MIEILKAAVEFIRKLPKEALAMVTAYILVPGSIFLFALLGVYSPSVGLDFAEPIAMAELQSEADTLGRITRKRGVAVIVEPVDFKFTIPLDSASTIWTSLDPRVARSNKDVLRVTSSELQGKFPLDAVSTPVAIVVPGKSLGEVWMPGRTQRLDHWRLEPRASIAILSNVLLVCVFTFGMALTAVLPLNSSKESAGAEISADPNQN